MVLLLGWLCLPGVGGAFAADTALSMQLKVDPKSFPASPGYHKLHGTAVSGGKSYVVSCGIYLPRAYFQPNEPLPIVVTLHNRGCSGSDGNGIDGEGLATLVCRNDPDTRGTGDAPAHKLKLHDEAQFITLMPQCLPGNDWHTGPVPQMMSQFIDAVAHHYRADPQRVYLTGFSYGASSTWRVALALPGRFAAIAPLDARATPEPKTDAVRLKSLPVYISVGDEDGDFIGEAKKMRDAFTAIAHPDFVFHTVPHGNHWCYASVYADPEFWKWMFSHRLGAAGTTRPTSRASTRQFAAAYTLSAVRVFTSLNSPASAPSTRSTTPLARPVVLCQYFRDLPGDQVKHLTADPAFPRFPNEQVYLDRLELPLNESDNFGTVLRTIVSPPTTGDYTLYLAGQDQCELWLSTDDKPEHLRQIAQVPAWSLPRDYESDPHQQSNPLTLGADKRYFLEVRHKHGVGDNHCSVAWRLPDGKLEGPIPGARCAAVPMVEVPPARVVVTVPADLRNAKPLDSARVTVDYLGRRKDIFVAIQMPRRGLPTDGSRSPALIYFSNRGPTDEFDGPVAHFGHQGKPGDTTPLIILSPERPGDGSWDSLRNQHAMAAAIDTLLSELPIDPERVYVTANAASTTALWTLATLLPGKFAVIVLFSSTLATDPALPEALNGTKVHLLTGVEDGMATDRTNRMKDFLAGVRPVADVVYEMHMGPEIARAYYQQAAIYDWMLTWHRPPSGIAEQILPPPPLPPDKRGRMIFPAIVGSLVAFAVVLATVQMVRFRKRRAVA